MFGDPACRSCGTVYSAEYWRQYNAKFLDGLEQEDTYKNTLLPNDIYFDTRLCCNRQPKDCDCLHPIDWDDVKAIPSAIDSEAYKAGAICEDCAHWWSPRCMPYRNVAYNYLVSGFPPKEPIDGCVNFEDDYINP